MLPTTHATAPPTALAANQPSPASDPWLLRFHGGDRATLAACYRDHFDDASRAISTILNGADRETVIHELFARLIDQPELRRSFQGGSFGCWLMTIARNRAIDHRRRRAREVSIDGRGHDGTSLPPFLGVVDGEQATYARVLVEQFRRTCLPPAWVGVFELRFLQQLPQREAAAQLSMHRTTLAYREIRIRRLLRRFLLIEDKP